MAFDTNLLPRSFNFVAKSIFSKLETYKPLSASFDVACSRRSPSFVIVSVIFAPLHGWTSVATTSKSQCQFHRLDIMATLSCCFQSSEKRCYRQAMPKSKDLWRKASVVSNEASSNRSNQSCTSNNIFKAMECCRSTMLLEVLQIQWKNWHLDSTACPTRSCSWRRCYIDPESLVEEWGNVATFLCVL